VTTWSFRDAGFARVVAHDGVGTVEAARVLDRGRVHGCRFVDLTIVHPGSTVGVHTHEEDEELYVIIDGRGIMNVDGERFEVESGDVILNPPHGTHEMWNEGTEPIRMVVVDVGPPEER
jgi:mannose-6-phosphate isomerase-like protein (cupin superfamily)